MLEMTYTKINEVKAALDQEYTAAINEKTVALKADAEKEVGERIARDLEALAKFSVLTDASTLKGLSGAQATTAIQGNNKHAAVTLALIDWFRQHPASTGAELADMGISIPQGLNVSTLKIVAKASLINDTLNAARPRLSLGIMALAGKA